MSNPFIKESAFETVLESHLLSKGYDFISKHEYNKEKAIFPIIVLNFIKVTQEKEWKKLEALLGVNTEEQVITDLCKWLDAYGSLATLRHGFKCYGRILYVAFFKAAHTMNPELEESFSKNILGITRQLQYSNRNNNSLDVTLSVNGIPIATLELKNPMTSQTVEDGMLQYRDCRDPRETLFEFKRRTLVHFSVDTEQVYMTTRLAGNATYFLPFNKGYKGGAGNPPDSEERTYRTAFLWEEVLERSSFLDLLARFIHLQIEEKLSDIGIVT
jgi:type I restriction enzyme R subunit